MTHKMVLLAPKLYADALCYTHTFVCCLLLYTVGASQWLIWGQGSEPFWLHLGAFYLAKVQCACRECVRNRTCLRLVEQGFEVDSICQWRNHESPTLDGWVIKAQSSKTSKWKARSHQYIQHLIAFLAHISHSSFAHRVAFVVPSPPSHVPVLSLPVHPPMHPCVPCVPCRLI